ncbi:MAG TPA: hypothetical protein VN932_01985 [Rhizomicrobium sp.]|nr:hypothetical protein [Rhizomicrobium sp.]
MSLSPDEAADALRDISNTEKRSFSAYGYKSAAPFLILWGLLWMVGYGGSDLWPAKSGELWLGVVVMGSVISIILGMRAKPKAGRRTDWRIFATWASALGFIVSMLAIVGRIDGAQIGALIPLLFAWIYIVMGVWMGWRFALAGVALGALTLGGFFLIHQHFLLWMAFVGGGTLVATGLWLRRA